MNTVKIIERQQAAVPAQGDNPARQKKKKKNAATGASFKIKETKMYVPVVNFSTENDHKLL